MFDYSGYLPLLEPGMLSMESSDSNESNRDEKHMSQNTNSNSASVIVAGPTGVTGSRVIKFGYKEFPVTDKRSMACIV